MADTTNSQILHAIRQSHIQLAKGHLLAALETYYGRELDEFMVVDERIREFIQWLDEEAPGIA